MKKTTKALTHIALLVIVTLFGVQRSTAQVPGVVRCYTDEADSALHALHPSMESKSDFEAWIQEALEVAEYNKIVGGVYQIPVVFHVIHSGEAVGSGTNVSQAAIQSQIDVLNEDFRRIFGSNGYNTNPLGADTEIEFCLAQRRPDGSAFAAGQPGVNRINYTSITATAPPYSTAFIDATIKPWTYNGGVATATRGWVPTKYMNIWLCNISGGILGYAQFPTSPLGGMSNCASGGSDATDGVVFLYSSIGKSSVTGFAGPYNEGRTATHEIGHWLGLRHIWGDGGCTVDDYCNDTPEAAAANYGCPTLNSCTNAPDPGNDMVENYMDYTDDLCMNIFTNDQKQRMRAVLEGSPNRVSLINSDACTPPNPSDASVTDVFSPKGDNCTGSITPSVQLRNRGSNALTSATISYSIDNGTATTFNWTGSITSGNSATVALPAFTTTLGQHTFKAWSTLPNGVADPSTTYDTSSISFMVSNGIQPNFTEDFEAETFPPDIKWVVENVNADCRQWTASSGTSASGTFINNMAMLPFFGNSSTSNENLYTPIFILPCNATAATIDFNVAYRQRTGTTNDRLIVEISQDCGSTWTSIYDKQGSTLAVSATLTGGTEYYPTAASHWRNEVVNLISYVGTSSKNIRFRFRGIANNGNNIFVDDIRFLATTPGEIQVVQGTTEVLDDGYYNFPGTQVGGSSTQTFTVNNTGSTNLILTPPITVTGTGFSLGTSFGATTIPAGGSTTFTVTFTPPSAGTFTGNVSFTTNDCDEGTYNFVLNGVGTTSPPVADFSGTPTTICQGGTVSFTNLSSNATSYSWSFGASATPSTSTATNPSVVFNTAGTFPITLTATNAYGSDVETKTGYITVVSSTAVALPLTEGFTTATFPPASWSIVNNNSSPTTWIRSTAAGNTPTTGNSMMFDNFNYNDSDDDEVRVRPVQLTGYTNATLTFDVAYAPYNASNYDGLQVLVSTNCGGSFTSVYSKSNTTLATATATTSQFTPTAAQWRTETVDLSAYVGQPNVIVVFKNLSGYGNRLFVDNINITGTVTATSSFTVNPNPACVGQTVTYTSTSTGASSYSWNFGAGATPATASTAGPHTVTYSSAGSKTVVLQINGSGPSSNQTVTINALPATPTITPSGATTFCAGGSVTLTSSAGTSYLWSNGATTQSINVTTSGTYTVQITNASGCQSAASAGTTVTVNSAPAAPTITPSGATTFCAGGSVTLTSSAGTSYLWSNGATTQSINVTTSGTYTVQVTNASGCQSVASAGTTVTVNSAPATPTITPSGATTFCSGGSVTLTSSAGSSYLWSTGATTASINVTTSGTYTVQVTNASGCQSAASAGTTVTVNSAPATPTITPSGATTFCSGGSVTLTSSAGSSYLWSTGATTASINVTNSGTYTVQVTNASGCQSAASAGTTVTVNATPAAPTITPSGATTFCSGGSVTLTSSAGSSYLWSTGATTASINVTTSGTYTVQVTNVSGCQSVSSTGTTVTVNPTPTIAAGTVTNPTTCSGTDGSIQVTGSGTGNLSWTGTTSGTLTSVTLPQTITGLGDGSYNFTFTSAAGCPSNTLSQSLVAPTAPSAPTITPGGTTTFCSGGSVTLTSSTGTTYLWSTGETTQSINVSTSGTYTVQITNASGCSSPMSSGVTVTVNTTPSISVGTLTNPSTCGGTDGSIQVSGSGTGNLSWTGTTSGSMTGVALPQTVNGLSEGSYDFVFTSSAGCVSNTLSQALVGPSAPSAPTITPGGATTFCSGGSVTLTSSTGTTYLWSTGETTQSISVTTSGTYTVQITNASGCSSPMSSAVTVTVNPVPSAPTITPGGATTFCAGGSVTLTSSAATGNNWSNGPTSQAVTVTTSGTYTVTETANGCTSAASTPVVVTVNANPTVTFGSLSDVCDYTSAFALTGGSPAGGTYSGNGVSGGNFDPASAGLGTSIITYAYTDGNGCSGSATSPILVDDCAGVDENTVSWNIYPNPSSGIISVVSSIKVKRVEVYDQLGKLVLYRTVSTENNQFEIDLSGTADGVYTVKLIGQSFTTQKPVVVKH